MAHIDRSWEQNEAYILTVFHHADCMCDACSGGETEQTLIALSPATHDHSLYWHRERTAGDQCRYAVCHGYAYSASELWTRDWRLWCMLAENSQFHQWVSDFNSRSVAFLVHALVIPASVCPAYQLDHHVACRQWDAFWCLLCLAAATHLTPAVCMTKYRPHFVLILFSRPVNASRQLALFAESDYMYCWLLSHSVSAISADT